jgi:NAD(P)-dependent dehydrogenase (short-subunit alcohol dehydrogenase family)
MSRQLDSRVAVVTGGSSGIGRAAAVAFAKAGAKVVIASRSVAGGEETVRSIRDSGGDAVFVQTDVTRAADIEALMAATVQTLAASTAPSTMRALPEAGSGWPNTPKRPSITRSPPTSRVSGCA